jgi:hypothetical protein
MSDPGSGNNERELFDALSKDEFFADWVRADKPVSADDLTRAINEVLGRPDGELPPLPGWEDRAMRRLVLFQIVMPYLGSDPISWSALLSQLTQDDVRHVEALLGDETLGELLE